jgi:hypothetical protein
MSQSTKRLEQEILSRKQDIAEIIKDLQLQVPNNGGRDVMPKCRAHFEYVP